MGELNRDANEFLRKGARRRSCQRGFPWAVVLVPWLLTACSMAREYPLATLRDLEDRMDPKYRSLAEAGEARAKRHPKEIRIALTGRFVETDDDAGLRRAYQIELHASDESAATLRFDASNWTLRDDTGSTFRCRGMQRWNDADEVWEPTDGTVAAGSSAVLATEYSVPPRHDFAHVVRVTLHWSYDFDGRRHLVATSFATR
ncbi:MAG: hypothetical protein KDC95_21275 [Planctomycetes bacterium]|nr:hypothetical protein [Planctomycetota bacterium]